MASEVSEFKLLLDMVTALSAATAGGYLATQLKQPALLGYLISGMAIGPAGLKLVSAEGEIQVLAEVGVALLLFALGVEFSVKELMRVRTIALGGGTLQILLTLLLGAGLALFTGGVESVPQAVFLGAVLSLSSTAVVLKSLIERNEVQTTYGQIMLAMLVVQDLGLGLMLAVLPALSQPVDQIGVAMATAVVKALLFLGAAVLAGRWVIPLVMRSVVQVGSQEIFLLTTVVICLGIAMFTWAIGLGVAMGAFVAGLMISNIEYADHALDRILPMRDVFATLFFTSIGILIDPSFLWENAWVLTGLVLIAMVGKAVIVTGVVTLFRYPLRTALTVGLGINQIGEFSFVLAGVAQSQGVFSSEIYGLTVGTTAATLLITPFLLKFTPDLLRWLERSPRLNAALKLNPAPELYLFNETELTDHVVVAGYGRVGKTLVRMLYFQGYPILVVDNNEARLQSLRDRQIPYLFGDVSSPLVLEKARLTHAKALAIALPDPLATRLTLKRALELAPDLDITVRAHFNDEIDTLYQLGAQEVVQPEFEASLEMGAHMLLKLGDSTYEVQQVVNRYRHGRYRDIRPERWEYWGAMEFETTIEGFDRAWYVIPEQSPLVGLSLAQANIRRLTGSAVMAVERQKQLNRYPTGEMVLQAGDRLLVVGNPQEQAALKQLLVAGLPPNPAP